MILLNTKNKIRNTSTGNDIARLSTLCWLYSASNLTSKTHKWHFVVDTFSLFWFTYFCLVTDLERPIKRSLHNQREVSVSLPSTASSFLILCLQEPTFVPPSSIERCTRLLKGGVLPGWRSMLPVPPALVACPFFYIPLPNNLRGTVPRKFRTRPSHTHKRTLIWD